MRDEKELTWKGTVTNRVGGHHRRRSDGGRARTAVMKICEHAYTRLDTLLTSDTATSFSREEQGFFIGGC